MVDRWPDIFRLGFSRSDQPGSSSAPNESEGSSAEVEFVAYGEDCLLVGRTILDADRLSDMLNAHDEYVLAGVTVQRLDGGESFEIDEIAVPRDEIFLVHAQGPRGDAERRHRTSPHHLAMKMGPFKVRGYFHALPGADPVDALRRRKAMVPLTEARIEYTFDGERREIKVDALIVNREQIDWVEAVLPTEIEFPEGPRRVTAAPA
jgi:hypothetical protein